MIDERSVAFHEAGHAVVAWYFGWLPSHVTLATETVPHGATQFYRDCSKFPGSRVFSDLVCRCVAIIQLASGGCAELRIEVDPDDCGWKSDYTEAEPIMKVLATCCGYEDPTCWSWLLAVAQEILAEPTVWLLVERMAGRLLEQRSLDGATLAEFFAAYQPTNAGAWLFRIANFIDTPASRYVEGLHP